MKPSQFDIRVQGGSIEPAQACQLLESQLRTLSKLTSGNKSFRPLDEKVQARLQGDVLSIWMDPEWVLRGFGDSILSWGMWIEQILRGGFPEIPRLELDWQSPGFEDAAAILSQRQNAMSHKSGTQKLILAALVALVLVMAVPMYGLWRMKVKAEEQVDRFVTTIDGVKSDLANQGKRLDVLYTIVTDAGSSAWSKVHGEISEWITPDSTSE